MKNSPASAARINRLSLTAAALGTLTLAACGGGGTSSSTTYPANSFPTATVVIGQANFTSGSPNQGGAVGQSTLSQPQGSVGSNGTVLYVPDYNNSRVLGFNPVPSSSTGTTAVNANFVLGQTSFTVNAPDTSVGGLAYPGKASVSSDGKLVVADTSNNRVLIWNSLPTSTDASPSVVVGQPDFDSSGSGTTAATLYNPTAAMIANGKLVVVDSGNSRVLVWNSIPTANGVDADVVVGQPDFTSGTANNACTVTTPSCSATAVAGQNNLNQPLDLWTDGYKLLVADTANNRVMYWLQIPSSNMVNASYVIGQSSFTRVTGSTAASSLYTPTGIASDQTRIYIADSRNNRVLVYNSFPTSNGPTADTVIGQHDFTHVTANDLDQNGTKDDYPSAQTLYNPTGVAIFNGSTLFVTDSSNHRILGFKQ